jgi:hypothetical protein
MVGIIEGIPGGLEKVVNSNLIKGEAVIYRLKGAWKEALVCTNNRVMIAKKGFMTGQIFGSDVFQLSYGSVASAQVKFHLLTGYFEVSAGGVQNTQKSYWNTGSGNANPSRSPNCVSLNSRTQADKFRQAAAFIMDQGGRMRTSNGAATSTTSDIATSLEKLWTLKSQGALSEAEYQTAKANLLAGR